MAKTTKPKAELTPQEKVLKIFNEDLNDTELQERYDRFVKELEMYKNNFNEIVPEYNKLATECAKLEKHILNSILLKFDVAAEIERFGSLQEKLVELKGKLDNYSERIKNQEELIQSYEEKSNAQFYHHWRYLKEFGVTEEPWLKFIDKYKNKII